MNEKYKAINDLVGHLRLDCHKSIYPNGWVEKNDADVWHETNLWLFKKLAELQIKINELENKI